MKPNEYVTDEMFACPCHSDEHRIVFSLYDWKPVNTSDWPVEERIELDVSVYLSNYRGFWKRLWEGLKYIFGYFQCRHGHFDCGSITYADSERLLRLITDFRKKVEEETEKEKLAAANIALGIIEAQKYSALANELTKGSDGKDENDEESGGLEVGVK